MTPPGDRSATNKSAVKKPGVKKPLPQRRLDAHTGDAHTGKERQSQFTLQMRESLRKELALKALESGMTMRGFIMRALRKSGLKVTEQDLVDRRRR